VHLEVRPAFRVIGEFCEGCSETSVHGGADQGIREEWSGVMYGDPREGCRVASFSAGFSTVTISAARPARARLIAVLLASAAAALSTSAEAAAMPACGSLYMVSAGDTLFRIAQRAYGDGWKYKDVFQANRDLLPDEQSVEIGNELLLPCLNGSGPQTRRAALEAMAAAAPSDTMETEMLADASSPATLAGALRAPAQPAPEAPAPVVAAAPSCATVHTVKRGETLFLIAQRAYGDGWKYKDVFLANRDLLRDEQSVEVGDDLLLPCADGTGPRDRTAAIAAGMLAAPGDAEAPSALADATDAGTEAPSPDQPDATAAVPQAPAAREFAQARGMSFVGLLARGLAGGALMPRNGLIDATDAGAPEAAEASVPPSVAALVPTEAAERPGEPAGPALAALDATAPVTDATPVADAAPEIVSRAAELLPAPRIGETGDVALLAMLDTARQAEMPATAGRLSDLAQPFSLYGFSGVALAVRPATLPGDVTEDALAAEPLTVLASVPTVMAEEAPPVERPAVLASAAADAPATAIEPAQTARRDPAETSIRFLTGAGFGYFAGPELIGGGMITDLVAQSMTSASPSQAFTVGFIDDWSRHAGLLRSEDGFDIGFPWYKPDCSAARMLSPQMQTLCTDFEFSRPFAEVPVAFYVRSGDPAGTAMSLGDLAGKRICRPVGQFTFDLEQAGLANLNVTFERPESALACFAALVRGRVDVVTLAAGDAESEIRLLGIADAIEPVEGLASVQTLHAIVAKANPHATDYLALINRGLENIMRSGKWFETVSHHQGRQVALNG